ncbi:MAG: AsmA family protein [Bacteroidetes bacterium]|nr:AsmA family protein [Bacteroidota bacterium]
MKKFFLVIAALILLVVIALVLIPILYKGRIIQIVKDEANKNLNAKVNFADVHINLIGNFPNLRFAMDELSVAGVGPFENDTLAYIKKFSLSLDLMSVIKGENISIKVIGIEKPRINAKVLSDGKANWDIAKETGKTAEPQKTEPAGEPSKLKIGLKSFFISDAIILYNDLQGDLSARIEDLDFELSGDMSQDFTSLDVHTAIGEVTVASGGIRYLNRAAIDLTASIDADLKNSKYTLKKNRLAINKLEIGADGFIAMPGEDITMDLKFFASKTEFRELLSLVPAVYMRDFEKVKTSGKLALEGTAKGVYRDSLLPTFTVKLLVENARFQYPDLPSAVENINIDLNVSNPGGTDDQTLVNINRFHFDLAKNPVDIRLLLKTPVSDPYIDCNVKGHLDLNKVKEVVPLEPGERLSGIIDANLTLKGNVSVLEKEQYEKFNASGNLAVAALNYASPSLPQEVQIYKMEMNFTPQDVNLNHFEAKIGESDFIASGRLENVIAYTLKDDAVLKGTCNLKSRRINLNQFMADDKSSAASEPSTPADTAPLSVIEIPDNLDFTLKSDIAHILYDKMEITNTTGLIRIKDGKVTMEELRMNMIDGSMTMNGAYDTKNIDYPTINFTLDISEFDIPKTFSAFSTAEKLLPIGKFCKGKFSSRMNISGLLNNKMEPVMNTLAGGGGLSTRNASIDNFEPLNKVADALGNPKLKKMTASDVNLSFKFKDGRLNVEPFDVKLGEIKANVHGSNGFDQTLDYYMKMEIPSSELGSTANTLLSGLTSGINQFGANLSVGKTVKVNLKVGGTISNPSVSVAGLDMFGGEGSVKEQVKDKVKDEAEKLKKEAEDKAKAEAERLKNEAETKAKAEADRLKNEAEAKAKAEAERLKKEAEEKAKKEAKDKLKNLFKK